MSSSKPDLENRPIPESEVKKVPEDGICMYMCSFASFALFGGLSDVTVAGPPVTKLYSSVNWAGVFHMVFVFGIGSVGPLGRRRHSSRSC